MISLFRKWQSQIKKVLIFEPHYDDAWLNLGGFILLNPQYEYKIVTISDHPTNHKNGTAKLNRHLKSSISHDFLRYKSLGFNDSTLFELEKKYETENHDEIFLKINGLTDFSNVTKEIKSVSKGYDAIFWPLGLKHPQHIVMDKLNPFHAFNYYREFPYHLYKDQKKIIASKTKNLKKIEIDISKVINRKIEYFKECYPEQVFLLDLFIGGTYFTEIKCELFWEN